MLEIIDRTRDRSLAPGTPVQVRNRLDGRWAVGFEVATVHDDGYLVRRTRDACVLPVAFAFEEVRADTPDAA